MFLFESKPAFDLFRHCFGGCNPEQGIRRLLYELDSSDHNAHGHKQSEISVHGKVPFEQSSCQNSRRHPGVAEAVDTRRMEALQTSFSEMPFCKNIPGGFLRRWKTAGSPRSKNGRTMLRDGESYQRFSNKPQSDKITEMERINPVIYSIRA